MVRTRWRLLKLKLFLMAWFLCNVYDMNKKRGTDGQVFSKVIGR